MKKISRFIVMCFSFLLCLQYAYALNSLSPVGSWKTIDDVTGQPKAIIQLSETPNNVLFGRILKIFPSPGHDQNEVCTACKGWRHNKRIVGMVVLENMRQDKNNPSQWSGGQILDPKNGKTYHCTIKVIDNGYRLNVRGYIGMPLFGRSQVWMRVGG